MDSKDGKLWERHFESEQGCNPKGLAMKRAKMASGILDFYRGSTGVFYSLWSREKPCSTPLGWICGDAHWENLGSFKGKNHVAYFDFTDFDHACLAPVGFDLGRALTCLFLLDRANLAPLLLQAYRQELAAGKPYHIENEVAVGTVARLLRSVRDRSQRKFIKKRAKDGRLLIDGKETYRLPARERREASRRFRAWALTMKNPEFFALLDLCGSYSGLGELGHRRYVALVRGKHVPHLIDMKEALNSAAAPFAGVRQRAWANQAERIAEIQRMIQYVPIARLGWTRGGPPSFIMSEYQPSEDRVDSLALSKREYLDFASQWGKLLAWSHLRGGGWCKGATTSELVTFAKGFGTAKQRKFLTSARRTAGHFGRLFTEFKAIVGAEEP